MSSLKITDNKVRQYSNSSFENIETFQVYATIWSHFKIFLMSIVENYQTFVAISNQLETVVQKFTK